MKNTEKHKKTSSAWQIERIIPHKIPWYSKRLVQEHTMRYKFAANYVKDKIVVELGCGTGYGSLALVKTGARRVIGIDINQQSVNYAKANYNHKKIIFMAEDAKKTSLKKGLADVVISFETIEHLHDPEKFINEVKRILKQNGIFILSTPNSEMSYGDNPYHIKEYKLNELNKLLKDFSKVRYYGQRPVNKTIIFVYKKIVSVIKSSYIKLLFRFRPWEHLTIKPIKSIDDTSYLYFLAVCRK